MRWHGRRAGAIVGLFAVMVVSTRGQQPPQGDRPGLYPALQREFSDPELVARGEALYGINCRGCHGVDLRGGDLGGPNLLRSRLVLGDRRGESMLPVIRDGRSSPGGSTMPPQALSEDDVRAVAEYIHAVDFRGARWLGC